MLRNFGCLGDFQARFGVAAPPKSDLLASSHMRLSPCLLDPLGPQKWVNIHGLWLKPAVLTLDALHVAFGPPMPMVT